MHYIGVRYFGADGSYSIMDFTFYNFIYGVGLIPWGVYDLVVGFWYIRALFYIVLLSPFLAWFIRKGKTVSGIWIITLLGLWCLQSRIHTTNAAFNEAMRYVFCLRCPLFFSIGMACAWYAPSRLPKFSAMLFVPLAIGSLAFAKKTGLYRPVDFLINNLYFDYTSRICIVEYNAIMQMATISYRQFIFYIRASRHDFVFATPRHESIWDLGENP